MNSPIWMTNPLAPGPPEPGDAINSKDRCAVVMRLPCVGSGGASRRPMWRMRRTRLTVAARVQWPVVGPVGGIANVHGAFRCVGRPIAPAARGRDAVEQVHTALYRGDEIRRESDTHKITGQCSGQSCLEDVDGLVHLVFRLAD